MLFLFNYNNEKTGKNNYQIINYANYLIFAIFAKNIFLFTED